MELGRYAGRTKPIPFPGEELPQDVKVVPIPADDKPVIVTRNLEGPHETVTQVTEVFDEQDVDLNTIDLAGVTWVRMGNSLYPENFKHPKI